MASSHVASSLAATSGAHDTRRWSWLPKSRHLEVPRAAAGARHARAGTAGRRHRVVHEFLARLLRRRPGARGHPRLDGHLRLRRRGQARRQLHPDRRGLGGGPLGHGRADPGDGVDGPAAAAGVAAGPLLPLHRHVRRGRGHALHADPRRPHAAHVSLGARGRQHPARAHRPGAAARVGEQAGQRHRHRHRHGRLRGPKVALLGAHRLLRLHLRRGHGGRRAHRHSRDGGRAARRGAHAVLRLDRLAQARAIRSARSPSSSRWA